MLHLVLLSGLFTSTAVFAAEGPLVVPLWKDGAPGSEGQTSAENVTEIDGVRRVSNIHNPSLTVHLPSKEKATGAAVIILPGGGHSRLSIENEGNVFAKWLNERGIAGLVLKYRLARETNSPYSIDGHAVPDVQRAVRLARHQAKEWNLDPQRIGVLGFSAGAELAGYAALRFDSGAPDAKDPVERHSSRPAFQGLLYGGPRGEFAPPANSPPAFICVAYDDRNPTATSLQVFQKLRDTGISAELHIYSQGGHGFGMRERPFPISGWPMRFYEWLNMEGFLKPASE